LLALRTRGLDEQADQAGTILSERKTRMEEQVAAQRKLEAAIEDARVRQSDRTDTFNEVQGRYYKVGSEIARLEQSIEHARDLRERQEQDLEQATLGAKEIVEHIDKDESEIAQLELTLNELVPGLEQAQEREQASAESLHRAEAALAEWQEQWDEYTTRLNESQQQRKIEHTRAEQIESRIHGYMERRRKLDESRAGVEENDLKERFEQYTAQEQRKRQARDEFERHLADIGEKIRKLREQDTKLTRLVDERRAALLKAQGDYASLEALQKAALGEGDKGVKGWFESTGIDVDRRVAKIVDVAEGWDRAVETVLGDYLQAICVTDLADATASIAELKSGKVTLLADSGTTGRIGQASSLAAKVESAPASVAAMLSHVRVADSLNEALALREQLQGQESVVTADGIWLGRNWLRVSRDKDAKSGVLAREHEMRRIKGEVR
jgi:chromosome segregation protein